MKFNSTVYLKSGKQALANELKAKKLFFEKIHSDDFMWNAHFKTNDGRRGECKISLVEPDAYEYWLN